MAKSIPTVWPIEEHTSAKLAILRRYLQAWLPIMSTYHGRIYFVDGFAGPGLYAGGEEGSPLVAVKAAVKHDYSYRLTAKIHYVFIERDRERLEHLRQKLEETFPNVPPNIVIRPPKHGAFAEVFPEISHEVRGGAPMFVLIDPFGFSDPPFSIVKAILANNRSEVLITFMDRDIARFLEHPNQSENFDSLFGTDRWREGIQMRFDPRRGFLVGLYRSQLQKDARAKFVRYFEMTDKRQMPIYCLFFATNNLLGLKKMKEAMWSVDPAGNYTFSDATNPNQPVLFNDPDYAGLQRALMERFSGLTVSVEEIERFVIADTAFVHFKESGLWPLEESGRLAVLEPVKRRKGTYPEGARIHFQ